MKKYLFLTLVSLPVFLASCLKDKEVEDQKYGLEGIEDKKLIELSLTPLSTKNYVAIPFESSDVDTVLDLIPVTFAYKDPAPEDINVELILSPALIGNYNALNGTMHEEAPSNVYTILNAASGSSGGYIVTIPKGERKAYLQIKIKPSDYLGHDYAIAFQISKIENPGYIISANFSTAIVSIPIKNKYDGTYRLQGHHNRSPYTFPYDTEIDLITQGPSSVSFYWPDAGSVGHPIGVGANNSLSWYGPTVAPVIVFDPATDLVTDVFNSSTAGPAIDIYTGAGSGQGRYEDNGSDIKIYVYWRYSANDLRAFLDTLTYIGPR